MVLLHIKECLAFFILLDLIFLDNLLKMSRLLIININISISISININILKRNNTYHIAGLFRF